MFSSLLSRVSAALLLAGGVALLFVGDVVLPTIIPGFPPAGAWMGQLLAAAWLAIAALDWLYRNAVLGGIYGRPVVMANLALYFISALSLLRGLLGGAVPSVMWLAAGPMAALAAVYGALLLRGPFDALEGQTAG